MGGIEAHTAKLTNQYWSFETSRTSKALTAARSSEEGKEGDRYQSEKRATLSGGDRLRSRRYKRYLVVIRYIT